MVPQILARLQWDGIGAFDPHFLDDDGIFRNDFRTGTRCRGQDKEKGGPPPSPRLRRGSQVPPCVGALPFSFFAFRYRVYTSSCIFSSAVGNSLPSGVLRISSAIVRYTSPMPLCVFVWVLPLMPPPATSIARPLHLWGSASACSCTNTVAVLSSRLPSPSGIALRPSSKYAYSSTCHRQMSRMMRCCCGVPALVCV